MPYMSSTKVLIVGGGLGGLALAQALRAKGIDYEVYERDTGDHFRIQGWALNLQEAVAEMAALFPSDMPPLEDSVSVSSPLRTPAELTMYGPGGEMLMRAGGLPKGQKGHFVRANRRDLRKWLAHNLVVNWNKRFTHYREDLAGVTAYFSDGTSSTGDILVACDGSSSHVREQLLGRELGTASTPPLGIIVGEVKLNEAQYKRQMAISKAFFIYNGRPVRLFSGIRAVAPDASYAEYFWYMMWPDEGASTQGRDYSLLKATKEDLYREAQDKAADMPYPFREIVDLTPVEGIISPTVLFKEYCPPEQLPVGRVTLLGDAAHAMVPFRGQGANTAISDSMDLARAIFRMAAGEEEIESALKSYEAGMLPRGRSNMLAAHASFTQTPAEYAQNLGRRLNVPDV